jgi:hypothetical protein
MEKNEAVIVVRIRRSQRGLLEEEADRTMSKLSQIVRVAIAKHLEDLKYEREGR